MFSLLPSAMLTLSDDIGGDKFFGANCIDFSACDLPVSPGVTCVLPVNPDVTALAHLEHAFADLGGVKAPPMHHQVVKSEPIMPMHDLTIEVDDDLLSGVSSGPDSPFDYAYSPGYFLSDTESTDGGPPSPSAFNSPFSSFEFEERKPKPLENAAEKSKSHSRQTARRRKRDMKKKQPERANFKNDTEYEAAFQAWRIVREKNNESVKRSRVKAKNRGEQVKKRLVVVEAEGRSLKADFDFLSSSLSVLKKAVLNPFMLAPKEQSWLKKYLSSPKATLSTALSSSTTAGR